MSIGAAILGAGALGAAGSAASGIVGANASKSAADTQAAAAEQGQQLQAQEFAQTQANLNPFTQFGTGNITPQQSAINQLLYAANGNAQGNLMKGVLTGPLGTGPNFAVPGVPTFAAANLPTSANLPSMASLPTTTDFSNLFSSPEAENQWLQNTPGYQFTLGQGLQGVVNQNTAQGLGQSGALAKAEAQYVTGLAGTTFQNQFQNFQTTFQNQFQVGQQNFQNAYNANQQGFANAVQVGELGYQNAFQNTQQQQQDAMQTLQAQLSQQGQQYSQALGKSNLEEGLLLNAYNASAGITGLGENAAAMTGTLGQQNVNSQTNLLTAGAAASAAGTIGSANAITGAIGSATSGIGSSISNYALLSALNGNSNLFGGSGATLALP